MAAIGLSGAVMPGEITQGGLILAVHSTPGTAYPVSTKPDTGALATGWRQVGQVAELPTIDAGIETEPVLTGVYGMPQAFLFKAMQGKLSAQLFGMEPELMALGLGVSPVVTPTATVTTTSSTFSVDSTTQTHKVSVTSATGLSVGQTVVIDVTASIGSSVNMAKILAISGTDITFDRLLRYTVASGSDFKVVKNVMLPIGGIQPVTFSLAMLLDFTDGRVGLINMYKVQTAKALTFNVGAGQEAVKTPLELQAFGAPDSTYGVLLGKIYIFPAV